MSPRAFPDGLGPFERLLLHDAQQEARSGGPEHIAHVVARVLDRIAAAIESRSSSIPPNDPPPPAQRPAA